MEDFLNQITLDDLDGENRELTETIGLEAFTKLIRHYGGTAKLYLTTADKLTRSFRDKRIREEYAAGLTIYQLSKKWALSDRWIYEIVKGEAPNGG